ncbi:hypothetical protein AQJ11_18110 [Streptomyces corchorusii]|uniref:Uncharacterized protein n=1 Tax=Streptomyces corchorusii TaxID=1903 RepID=A0A101QC03_STRCK|nr:hypothetical protein AQJ11_18110 [Streptomyces corchorusii]
MPAPAPTGEGSPGTPRRPGRPYDSAGGLTEPGPRSEPYDGPRRTRRPLLGRPGDRGHRQAVAPGTHRSPTWTVCVDAWRVPVGMRVETRDVSVRWE